jgi:hypothetical protein
MALPPAYEMARELPSARRALPVLKVLYRNTDNIRKNGGRTHEVLHPIDTAELPEGRVKGELLREAMRHQDMAGAERTFAAMVRRKPEDAYNDLQLLVQDELNVHRVVLAYRAWEILDLTGREHAHSMLRQSVRFCVQEEQDRVARHQGEPTIRTLLPALLEQHGLLDRPLGERKGEDSWLEQLSRTIVESSRDQAAAAAAAALAEGYAPEEVGEALSLAANQLVLRDRGRRKEWAQDGKPEGSVHGDSVGVHASDAANAWRNIARISNRRNTYASLIVGAYHTAGQTGNLHPEPYPLAEHREAVRGVAKADLLAQVDAAIRSQDQARACALVHRCGKLGGEPRPVFDLLLRYATSEDGALHAEKYYRTVSQEFHRSRPRFRWRHLAALARVTASEYGRPAPGYTAACELLKG